MADLKILKNLEFSTVQCYSCGVEFAMPAEMMRSRRTDHQTFHCPNGHAQSFIGKTEAEKLKEQLAAEQTRRITADNEATYQKSRAERATKNLARIQKRVKHGVCPCCKRTVKQLTQHMATKHPEFKTDGEP